MGSKFKEGKWISLAMWGVGFLCFVSLEPRGQVTMVEMSYFLANDLHSLEDLLVWVDVYERIWVISFKGFLRKYLTKGSIYLFLHLKKKEIN